MIALYQIESEFNYCHKSIITLDVQKLGKSNIRKSENRMQGTLF